MTDAPKPVRRRAAPKADSLHSDVAALTTAVGQIVEALKPLADIAPHASALAEMAAVYSAGKNGTVAAGRFGIWLGHLLGRIGKWSLGVATSFALVWAAIHHRWDAVFSAVLGEGQK